MQQTPQDASKGRGVDQVAFTQNKCVLDPSWSEIGALVLDHTSQPLDPGAVTTQNWIRDLLFRENEFSVGISSKKAAIIQAANIASQQPNPTDTAGIQRVTFMANRFDGSPWQWRNMGGNAKGLLVYQEVAEQWVII